METNKGKIFLNTILWGFLLWLFGYTLGFIFFAFVPKNSIGWFILPFGVAATLWVLFKKIERESFTCYIGLGIFWLIIATVFDYFFLVRLLESTDYYKLDVYLYYFLIFALPIAVGWFKFKRAKMQT
jgi:hypothetical protein